MLLGSATSHCKGSGPSTPKILGPPTNARTVRPSMTKVGKVAHVQDGDVF